MECAAHRYDRLKHHGHHWIEEGTEDDFKWCILNSDLPVMMVPLVGTYVVHIGSAGPTNDFLMGYRGEMVLEQGIVDPHVLDNPPPGIALMGTVAAIPAPVVADDYQHFEVHYHAPVTSVNKKLIEVLMARPEVVNHEPKAKALGAAA